MAFWTDTNLGNDPKRNFRWQINIGYMTGKAGDSSGIVWYAKKVQKPNFTITESKHAFLNHTFYWPGRVEWAPITLTLVDPVEPANAVQLTNAMIQASGYVLPAGVGVLETMSKKKAGNALSSVILKQLDAQGKTIEEWTLKNPFIKSVKFGDLDYENDDLTIIDIEFRYDWATCTIKDGEGTEQGTFYETQS
jgi:hypothetical protein